MTAEDKIKLITLGQQLSTVGAELRIAQLGLENMVEQYGMSSDRAVEAARQCGDLDMRFSQLEEEFLALKEKYQK